MKNFYEVVKSGVMVSNEDDKFFDLNDLYSDFCNDAWTGSKMELEYQGSPIVLHCLEQYGGEGLGEEYFIVFSVTYNNETTNYKVDGWYASYSGHEFSNLKPYEVEQKEVCKMEWVAK